MHITQIDLFRADIPMRAAMAIATNSTAVSESLFVRITTDAGLNGIGEGNYLRPVVGETPATGLAAAQFYAKLLIGADPRDIESCTARMAAALPHNPTTRSAFDIALWDLLGKAAGLPLHALLGGGGNPVATDNTVYLEPPAEMARRAGEFVRRGFTAIKIKVGTTIADDVARVKAVREAAGRDTQLRIDANQGWDRVTAHEALEMLAPFGIAFCEQPLRAWDIEGMAEVTANSPIPIMADEAVFDDHDALGLVAAKACDYFNIKLAKSGGIAMALRINAIAEAAGFPCMIGCMSETRIGITAAAHFAAARTNIRFADLDGAELHAKDPVIGGLIYGPGGKITLPDTPGIGATLDGDFLASLPVATIQ
jgi:L-alanine-DL-glutamate epimerase-like enolase superfamily enzyme